MSEHLYFFLFLLFLCNILLMLLIGYYLFRILIKFQDILNTSRNVNDNQLLETADLVELAEQVIY